ncbi:MAG: Xaa-Pro peptidase family protein [Coriobacteriales bacterium]|jgi:Xaa-Pro aminopeptidase|nr:Xaa-Pro peptidase family protein [Coriobacteriales bacterium]
MTQTLKQLRETLQEHNFDACVVTHTSDLRWLTGWELVFDSERAHTALITSLGAALHTDGRYSGIMRERDPKEEWLIDDTLLAHSEFVARELENYAKAWAKPPKPLRVAIENDLPLNRFRALEKALGEKGFTELELVETEEFITKLRAVKTPAELKLLKKAQEISDAAFYKLFEWLRPGLTEIEIAAELEHIMRAQGAEGIAFPTIVASGPNTANPHVVPTNRAVQKGDFLLLDYGVRYRDYCSDTTRTLFMDVPNSKQDALYHVVLAAFEAARDIIKPGITGEQVHECAANVLKKHGYAKQFLHSLGHGVGIKVHELPRLAPKADAKLVVGNVVAVEPGVYLPGFGGIRIEDCGVVTESGFESFTTLPIDSLVIAPA